MVEDNKVPNGVIILSEVCHATLRSYLVPHTEVATLRHDVWRFRVSKACIYVGQQEGMGEVIFLIFTIITKFSFEVCFIGV